LLTSFFNVGGIEKIIYFSEPGFCSSSIENCDISQKTAVNYS